MNIKKITIFILILVALFSFNHFYLGLSIWTFTGIALLLWVFLGIIGVLVTKFYKKKRGIPQSDDSYVFPDVLSNIMKKVDMRTQYEASLLSISFILMGLIAMAIYTVTFMDVGGWAKFMITFNMFWGFIFLTSFLVTNYQQYVAYLQTAKLMDELGDSVSSSEFLPLSQPGLPPFPGVEEESPMPPIPKEALEAEKFTEMKGGQTKHG